jgi:hypothetical protein
MAESISAHAQASESLQDASLDRLACLLRHWAWADEAMLRFERELTTGWDYDEDLVADHPFGAYYHWCALLCGLSEEALEHGLLSPPKMEALRGDLETSIGSLRACRQFLVAIPASFEEHPRVVDVLRDRERLARLRRVHEAFGELLREERLAREIQALDT